MTASETRGYQPGFFHEHEGVRDAASRARKARKIATALRDHAAFDLTRAACLDVGCSSGLITAELAPLFRLTVGGDYDLPALRHAPRPEAVALTFSQVDAMRMPLKDSSVDVVICAQVYEHVPNDERLADEILRVLRPGGVVFFSGPNWLYPIEPHYFLPFLHWLPPALAGAYLRAFKMGDSYYERSRTYWGLRRLWRRFEIVDITADLLKGRPGDLTLDERMAWLRKLPLGVLRVLVPLMPNFNWMLRKAAA